MKRLFGFALLLSLLTAVPAFAGMDPPKVPPKGVEGPDIRAKVEPKGLEGPDIRHFAKTVPKGLEGPDVR